MTEDIIVNAEERMEKSIKNMKNELAKIRSGRAHPSLLEHILVSYYGNDVPITQVASVSVLDPRTLNVSVWEKNLIPVIEKAIMTSDLGLNPHTAGESIKVPLPALSEDRRKELIKVVRSETEKGRVSVRNIRRDANTHLKDLVKRKEISKDDERRAEAIVQKLTNNNINKIDQLLSAKETELMEI